MSVGRQVAAAANQRAPTSGHVTGGRAGGRAVWEWTRNRTAVRVTSPREGEAPLNSNKKKKKGKKAQRFLRPLRNGRISHTCPAAVN